MDVPTKARCGAKKQRPGARHIKRVKSGCLTCKIRHKKCDEKRPSCTQCLTLSHNCEFSTSTATTPPTTPPSFTTTATTLVQSPLTTLPYHQHQNNQTTLTHFSFFREVCAPEYSLFYTSPIWEPLILRVILHEEFAWHAALAISALTRSHYDSSFSSSSSSSPAATSSTQGDRLDDATSPHAFANSHYTLALRLLNARLEREGWDAAEMAVLGSVMFVNIEFLRAGAGGGAGGRKGRSLVGVHVEGGLGVLRCVMREGKKRATRLVEGWDVLEDALGVVRGQIEGLGGGGESKL
ncbi:unnamed protein product [Periconia digitata]|uniref:Zn(2)-C6 fungal-type domain-containing protein n=1 Tax=Periconia digitata TaxID=1303443 RepID=A0A9W4U7K3_9PLEO|nr:unnamed protein product [Periconia digitata]